MYKTFRNKTLSSLHVCLIYGFAAIHNKRLAMSLPYNMSIQSTSQIQWILKRFKLCKPSRMLSLCEYVTTQKSLKEFQSEFL